MRVNAFLFYEFLGRVNFYMRDFICSLSATNIFFNVKIFLFFHCTFISDSFRVQFDFSCLRDTLYLKNMRLHDVSGLNQQMFFEEWFGTFFTCK